MLISQAILFVKIITIIVHELKTSEVATDGLPPICAYIIALLDSI